MFRVNHDYLNLQGSYLFSEIAERVRRYTAEHPEKKLIRLGIGDVTKPLPEAVIQALRDSVEEMGSAEHFRGYAPDLGYDFLREKIAEEYRERGCTVAAEEIFISDGAKSDSGNLQEIFAKDTKVAVCDPVYPVYVDANVMAGRSGAYNAQTGRYENLLYMPCTEENGFAPAIPKDTPELIYLCFPNNPTGEVLKKTQLQEWVDYANRVGAVILYDAAYEAYIAEVDVPHSIYECEGARECAIEIRSFSKNAGFTGLRLGFTVIPRELRDQDGHSLWDLWKRRHGTKYNGAPYIVQRAGEAVYSPEGKKQCREMVQYYMTNARMIYDGLQAAGYTVYGGKNAPYIWLKVPKGLSSWDFFDHLLRDVQIVGTPGSGFGPSGEGYFRLTAFGSHESTGEAMARMKRS